MKNIYKLLTVLGILLFGGQSSAFAQDLISGYVKDAQGTGLEYATILLLNSKDSSLAKGAVSDPNGKFEFEQVKPGRYLFKISSTGMKNLFVPPFEYAGGLFEAGEHRFAPISNELKTVEITAVKPIIEIKAEKMILNVENNVSSAGSDGLEILRKAPGVVIDNNENITLKGKNGVQVYIDGRPARLGGGRTGGAISRSDTGGGP